MYLSNFPSNRTPFKAAFVIAVAFMITSCKQDTYSKLPEENELEKLARELSDADRRPEVYYPSHSITYLKDDHNPSDAIRYLQLLEQNGRYFDTISTAIQLRDWYEREGIPEGSKMDKEAISNSLESCINQAVGELKSRRPEDATERAVDYYQEGDEVRSSRSHFSNKEKSFYAIACLKKSIEYDPMATMDSKFNPDVYDCLHPLLRVEMQMSSTAGDPERFRVRRVVYQTGLEIAKGLGMETQKLEKEVKQYAKWEKGMLEAALPFYQLAFIPIS